MTTVSLESYQAFLEQVLQMEMADHSHSSEARQPAALSVRVSPNGYWAAVGVLSFASLLCFRLQYDWLALAGVVAAWAALPLLAYTDRVHLEGEKLRRRGVWPSFWGALRGRSRELAVADVEWIETSALRALRSGGRVYYRYRCEIMGNGLTFVIASGGASFRRLVRALFAQMPEAKLDARSIELRDHLVEPETLQRTLGKLRLASEDLLKNTAPRERRRRERSWFSRPKATEEDLARGQLLRRAANELYVLGRLREAAEAFRRALLVLPHDAWLIYEFARFLHSQAGALSDHELFRRGQAALRLAALRGARDAALLARVGESFLEYGDSTRAERVFRRALEYDPRAFRAAAGLAEIGLRRGQLAHVLHHYNGAAAAAPDAGLARLAEREIRYYANLHSDDDYLEAELRRLNWLHHLTRARHLAARMTLGGTVMALLGGLVSEKLAPLGWAAAASALLCWVAAIIGSYWLAERRERAARAD